MRNWWQMITSQMYCKTRFEDIMGVKITNWLMDSFCLQLCYEGAETWVPKILACGQVFCILIPMRL